MQSIRQKFMYKLNKNRKGVVEKKAIRSNTN